MFYLHLQKTSPRKLTIIVNDMQPLPDIEKSDSRKNFPTQIDNL